MSKLKLTKKKLIILIVAAILLLALIGVGIWYFFFSGYEDIIIKKRRKIIVNSSDTVAEEEDDDYSDEYIDDNILITIFKKFKNPLFDMLGNDDDTVNYVNEDSKTKTLYAKDFGVKGDGKTDDGPAVSKAMLAILDCGPGSKLIFEKNKTYLINNSDISAVYLKNVKGITVDGGNSTFLLKNKKPYLTISDSKDCKVENFHFDHYYKSAFTATFVKKDGNGILMKADRNIGLKNGQLYVSPISGWFGVLNKGDSRYHMYIESYKMADTQNNTFYIKFTGDANTNSWASNGMLEENGMICPMPEYGHTSERGFTVDSNDNLTLSNLKIHDCSRFGMYIGSNKGVLNFNAVDFVPAENSLDKNMNFTSWRDAFHVKDNSCAIHWKNCVATGNYDDIYNISCTTCYLSEYNIAKNRLNVVSNSSGGGYPKIFAGDTVNIIDTSSGEDLGSAKVTRVIKQSGGENIFVVDNPIDRLSVTGKDILVFFTSRCAPNSTIENCDFNGTFRFRGPLTVTNTKFYNQRTWIDLHEDIEGPIPKNITFKNCEIVKGSGATIILGANSQNTEKHGYHIENIKFEKCKFDPSMLSIYSSDKKYVILRDCTDQNGSKIADMN